MQGNGPRGTPQEIARYCRPWNELRKATRGQQRRGGNPAAQSSNSREGTKTVSHQGAIQGW